MNPLGLDLSRTALIACEESGIVRRAFAALGYDAWSCDLHHPAADGSNKHLQMDLKDVLHWGWGLLCVMHPPCTILCNSGRRWLFRGGKTAGGIDPARWQKLEEGAAFYRMCRAAPIPHIAIENPVMHDFAVKLTGRGPTHFRHPHHFGDPFFKLTGIETINLPELAKTHQMDVPKPGTPRHKAWCACHRTPPGPNRARDRSRTYPGLARELARQYGPYLEMTK